MSEGADLPDVPDVGLAAPAIVPEHDDRAPRFTRVIAALIALLAVLASCLGYLVADANREANRAAASSRTLAIEHQGTSARANDLALAKLDGVLRWQTAKARMGVLLGAGRLGSGDRELWQADSALAKRALDAAAGSAEVKPDDRAHVERDTFFPYRLFVDTVDRRNAEFVSRQDALAERTDRWHRRGAAFLGALLVVAVGIYLFGFALTLEGHAKVVLVVAGVGLGLAGLGWAASGYGTSVAAASDRVHESFARGRYALLTASTPDEATRAINHLTAAISERPTFARAYLERADAWKLRALLKLGVDAALPSVFPPADLRRIVDDQRAAVEAGLDDPRLVLDLGFNETIAGLQAHDDKMIARGLKHSRRAARMLGLRVDQASASYVVLNASIARFNEGFAFLAAGDEAKAREVYRGAGLLLRKLEAISPSLAAEVTTGALTDLGLVESARPSATVNVRELKEIVVSGSRAPGGANNSTVLKGGKAIARIDLVRVEGLRPSGSRSKHDSLVEIWYRKIADRWQAVPGISSTRLKWTDFQESDSGWMHENSFLMSCNPAGRYKVELYLDGKLQRTLLTRNSAPRLQTPTIRGVRLRLCAPESWKPRHLVSGAVEGLVDPRGDRGVVLFRLPAMPGTDKRTQASQAVSAAIATLPLPARLQYDRAFEPDFVEWLLYEDYERAYPGSVGSEWSYARGRVRVQAAVSSNGDEVIGIATFGPRGFVPQLGEKILSSVRSDV